MHGGMGRAGKGGEQGGRDEEPRLGPGGGQKEVGMHVGEQGWMGSSDGWGAVREDNMPVPHTLENYKVQNAGTKCPQKIQSTKC